MIGVLVAELKIVNVAVAGWKTARSLRPSPSKSLSTALCTVFSRGMSLTLPSWRTVVVPVVEFST